MGEHHAGRKVQAIEKALARPLWKIALEPELEEEYRRRTDGHRLRTIAGWQFAAVLTNLACLPLDYLVGQIHLGLALRLGIVTPIYSLAMVWLLRGPDHGRSAAIAAPLVSFIGVAAYLGLQVEPPHTDRYLMAAGLLLIFTTIVVPTSLMQAIADIVVSAGGMLVLVLFTKGSDVDLLVLCAFIGGVSLVPLIARFRAERGSRGSFLIELRDELKSAHLLALTKALAELADTDPLTGLRNRRSLSETLNQRWADACARNDWFGILMIDIDRFKSFNDAAGHEEGDSCLKRVAGALQAESNRQGCYIARFGGEEFTAILPGLAPEPAMEVAEQLRKSVEALAIPHPACVEGAGVTVSIGGSMLQPPAHADVQQVMAAADRALYEAKASGRNCVRWGAAMAWPAGDAASREQRLASKSKRVASG
jgi:diguanylate cyclase (GGDEF)-like protein